MAQNKLDEQFNVVLRWRPLTNDEAVAGPITYGSTQTQDALFQAVSISVPDKRPWISASVFKGAFEPVDDNQALFDHIVAPALPKVLDGASCNYFAYGHSGSGKTHTMFGYDYDSPDEMGLCLAAARKLFESLSKFNKESSEHKLGVGFSLFEVRQKSAFDLLNGRTPCHIAEDHYGETRIRGPTEMLEDGKLRVQPISQRSCWTYDFFKAEMQTSLGLRSVGSSSVHDQSSRTHTIFKLEVINAALVEARQAVIDRESELVPVGERATDVTVEEQTKGFIRTPDGGYVSNPDYTINQARIDAAVAEKENFEARVRKAEKHVAKVLNSSQPLGGAFLFVDLAGAEYQQDKSSPSSHPLFEQTPQERQEGRQINTDLLALKGVIRAYVSNQSRIPFRSSPLTMVLQEYFPDSRNGTSAMIVTVSPAMDQYAATLNSLKFGSQVGIACV
ncbi:kinesin-like protein [Flagelloscypha sp. PMI_526]|nr:kinesin-like protein [Flagelloscypha sp. PMI_526]